jgi:hypothetical protein
MADDRTLDELVERWFDEHFRGSHVSRAGADAWNVAHAAKDDLKQRLRKLLSKSEDE